MRLTYTLCLPRDELTVPVVRRLLRAAMGELGVSPDWVSDVELAVTEACANVIEHAHLGDDEYEVSVELSELACTIRVVDTGRGFDSLRAGEVAADGSAERGRGIHLMKALVDRVQFEVRPEQGTVVQLYKELDLREDAVLKRIVASGGSA